MIPCLTDQELEQGWVDVRPVYGGGSPAGLPARIRLTRPGTRRAVHVFSQWLSCGRNDLLMINACLPPDQPAEAWADYLTAYWFEKIAAAAYELVLGRDFARAILRSISEPPPEPPLLAAAAQLRANPMAWFSQLTAQQSDCGQVELALDYYLGCPPEGLPGRVTLTIPAQDKEDLAGEFIRRRNDLFFLVTSCLPIEWRSGAFLDSLTIPCLYRLTFAAMELCLGRQGTERIARRIAAGDLTGGLFVI